jgi:predicted O-methyltransferase YrrM
MHRFARNWLGVEVRRVRPASAPAAPAELPKSTVRFEIDERFNRMVEDALTKTGSAAAGEAAPPWRRGRLYNLVRILAYTEGVEGRVAEVGTFRGMSAYMLCASLRDEDGAFRGAGVDLFDSFEGISEPTTKDGVDDPTVAVGGVPRRAGLFAASVESVRSGLAEFPDVALHPGWVPDCFADAPQGPYRFVHLDLDLHGPTLESLRFFVPRLAPGGALVIDDHGSVRWPGVREAAREFSDASGRRVLELSSGQGLIVAPK